jgi:hypothetical protein
MCVAILLFLSLDRQRLGMLFDKLGEYLLSNIVNSFSVISVFFLFGFLFSRLHLLVRSGSFFQRKVRPAAPSTRRTPRGSSTKTK